MILSTTSQTLRIRSILFYFNNLLFNRMDAFLILTFMILFPFNIFNNTLSLSKKVNMDLMSFFFFFFLIYSVFSEFDRVVASPFTPFKPIPFFIRKKLDCKAFNSLVIVVRLTIFHSLIPILLFLLIFSTFLLRVCLLFLLLFFRIYY